MTNIYFDIETIPPQNEDSFDKIKMDIKPPASYKKQEAIDKWYADNLSQTAYKIYKNQSLDGLLGEIISIAWAIDDEPVNVLCRDVGFSEYFLLCEFFNKIENHKDKHGMRDVISKWIGHNIVKFDLRFLWQRCVIHHINPPMKIPYNIKPWDSQIFDTLIAWAGANPMSYSGKSSLDDICIGLNMKGKSSGITGDTIYENWIKGKILEIAEYNKNDVEITRALYKRFNFILE